MPIEPPDLDDRTFEQLLAEATARIDRLTPQWTDRSPSDPGMVLLELFAYLTDTLLYRLNRVPEKAFIEFLRLIGVTLQPPAAARVELRFAVERAGQTDVEIPRGTRVAAGRAGGGAGQEPPVFVTVRRAVLPAGETAVTVPALHGELVDGELAGQGDGRPGQTVGVRRPPVIAATGDGLDLVVGVEARPDELEARAAAREHEGKTYRVWQEVDNFSDVAPGAQVYVADRLGGTISFAPALRSRGPDGALLDEPTPLAAVPPAGREIRLWYRRGGGAEGNVAAGTLTVLKDAVAGGASPLVANPEPATGGRAAETLANALIRGPQELHSLERAVTARDFRLVAERSGAVVRARAFTSADLWAHAEPGTVEVLLVPQVPEAQQGGRITAEALQALQTQEALDRVTGDLDERRPLGTRCLVSWTRYKTVRVRARVVVRREENLEAVRGRVTQRLYGTLSPLPAPGDPGRAPWGFGQALRASDVFDIALKEPGVRWVDGVRLLVDEVPDREVRAVVADAFQPRTWYAGSGPTLFRSVDDGEGWEPVGRFPDERVRRVRSHPQVPGLLAVVTGLNGASGGEGQGSHVYVSRTCGETWEALAQTAFEVEDAAWTLRAGAVPVLLLATDKGLYELVPRPDSSPVPVRLDPGDPGRALYAVAATADPGGAVKVAVAAQSNGGVYLSRAGGERDSFRMIGLQGEDVRVLAVQYDNVRSFLWAGVTTPGGEDPGRGCFSWETTGAEDPQEGWVPYRTGWQGGSCHDLAFQGTRVLAASHRLGVQVLEGRRRDLQWTAPEVRSGLPTRQPEPGRPGPFEPVRAVAAVPPRRIAAGAAGDTPGGAASLLLAGTDEGVFKSVDALSYEPASSKEFRERVTLPDTWLFCSGEHDLVVVGEDGAR